MASLPGNIKQSLVAASLIVAAAVYALIGIAHPPQGETITNEAVSSFLYKTGQRMVVRSNMTETIVQNASIATIIELDLSAEALVGNGVDSCQVTARVYDASGNPVPDGQPVQFTSTGGRFSNGQDTTYTLTVGGAAIAWLRSDVLPSSQPLWVTVGGSTLGASGQSLTRFLPLVFYSAALKGTIVSAGGRSVQGMIVVAYNEDRSEAGRDTTKGDGNFLIAVSQSGTYMTAFRYTNAFGDDISVFANRSVTVPSSGGDAAVSPLGTIVGNIVNISNGQPVRKSQIQVMLYQTSANRDNQGRTFPALGVTDDRGVFAFDSLSSGSFELHVMDVQYSGRSSLQEVSSGMFLIDANIQLVDAPAMEVIKSSNKRIAEIGDVVTYSVVIRNIGPNAPLMNVRLIDDLPVAFVYSAHSARRDSVRLPNPENKRKLEWQVADTLQPGKSLTVTYSVILGSAALEGTGINKAYAVAVDANGLVQRSIEATAQVTVRPGVFTDRGIVLGKVFYDLNENGQQEEGEKGIARVELWMEDGTRIITGDDGKYSLPEVRTGQHVLRVNDLTLPYGTELLALKAESAGDGMTRFVRLTEGGIARTDFYVRPPDQANGEVMFAALCAQRIGERIPATYVLNFGAIDAPTKISLTDTLPHGFSFDYKSITWRGMSLYPQGVSSNILAVDFRKRAPNSTDSIHVEIVTDTSAVGKQLESRGVLALGYPRNRDAHFVLSQRYLEYSPKQSEPSVKIEQPVETEEAQPTPIDSAKMPVQQIAQAEEPVTPATQSEVAPKDERKKMIESKPPKASGEKRAKKVNADRPSISADTSKTGSNDTVLRTPLDTSRLKDLVGQDRAEVGTNKSLELLQSVGAVTAAALLTLLLLLFWRRRRNGGEERAE